MVTGHIKFHGGKKWPMDAKATQKEQIDLTAFNLQRHLKAAHYGNVYLATNTTTGEQCVIKQLVERKLDPRHMEVFEREIEMSSRAMSPYIVKFLGFHDAYPYSLVYEYMANGNLNTFLYKRKLELSGTQKSIIAIGIAYSMRALHQKNLVHGNLSSWNVLLDQNLVPKVMISRSSHELSNRPKFIDFGQPNYAAREKLLEGKETLESDVFSYGLLLRELVTGKKPFENMTVGQIRASWRINPRLRCPESFTGPMADLINSCLVVQPKERPTFEDIVKQFKENQNLYFPDSNSRVVRSFIDLWDRQEKFERPGKETPYNEYVALLREDKSHENIMNTVLGSTENAEAFMRAAVNIFCGDNELENRKNAALELMHLLGYDKSMVQLFVSTKLYERCLLKTKGLVTYCLSLLLPVFEVCPEVATPPLIQKIEGYFGEAPVKVLRLFWVLTQHFTEEKFQWAVADSLLLHAPVFFDTKGMCDYVQVIYSLVAKFECFRRERAHACVSIFRRCIDSADEQVIKLGYSILTSLERREVNNPAVLLKHSSVESLAPSVLRYLTVVKVETVDPAIIEMLVQSNEVKLASSVLWRFARSPMFFEPIMRHASYFTRMDPQDIVTLLLVMMCNKELQEPLSKLAEMPSILAFIAKSGEPELLIAICSMIRRFTVTPEFVSRLEANGFIAEYIEQSSRINTPENYYYCCLLVDFLMRAKFTHSFLNFLPVIVANLTSNGPHQMASLSLLVLYSGRTTGRQRVRELNVPSLIDQIKIQPESVAMVEKLRKNLSR